MEGWDWWVHPVYLTGLVFVAIQFMAYHHRAWGQHDKWWRD
jgi:hypothetical protein